MKGLHKKISAVALSGMLALGGVASSGLIVNANHIMSDKVASNVNINDFIEKKDFIVFAKESSEQKLNNEIKDILKNAKKLPNHLKNRLNQLLSEDSHEVNSKENIRNLLKSGKQVHKIKAGGYYYLFGLDEVRFYASNNGLKHSFNSKENRRNYAIMEFYSQYSKKNKFDIIQVADNSDYSSMVVFESKIRSYLPKHIQNDLLKEPKVILGDVENIRLKLKSGDIVFKEKGYCRVRIEKLDYILFVKN